MERSSLSTLLVPNRFQEAPQLEIASLLPGLTARVHVLADHSIARPEHAFKPDPWTDVLLAGLMQLDLSGKTLVEIGVGTGVNPIALLLHNPEIAQIWGSDIDALNSLLAIENVRRILSDRPELAKKYRGVFGGHNLLSWQHGLLPEGSVDVLYACIPQVQKPDHYHGTPPPDAEAHEFDPKLIDPRWKHAADFQPFSLGLNFQLLCEARKCLRPGKGEIILNLAGRCSKAVLFEMFTKAHYTPRVIHEAIVPQHELTKLQELVKGEKFLRKTTRPGFCYEFFADAAATEKINAAQAEKRRVKREPLFHKIYVIAGVPNL